tara:strand:- start:900 stop:1019 length:120 start_codon:yes stop_codon:yes gene_type:complete
MHKKLAAAPTVSDLNVNDVMKIKSVAKLGVQHFVATQLH